MTLDDIEVALSEAGVPWSRASATGYRLRDLERLQRVQGLWLVAMEWTRSAVHSYATLDDPHVVAVEAESGVLFIVDNNARRHPIVARGTTMYDAPIFAAWAVEPEVEPRAVKRRREKERAVRAAKRIALVVALGLLFLLFVLLGV